MKYHEKTEVDRRYWSVGDLAKQLNIADSCIRYWLIEFGIDDRIKRNRAGERILKAGDVDLLTQIHYLLKVELFTIPGAKRKLAALLSPYRNERIKVDESEVSNMLRVGCIVLCFLVMSCRPYFNQANVVKVEKGKHSQIGR